MTALQRPREYTDTPDVLRAVLAALSGFRNPTRNCCEQAILALAALVDECTGPSPEALRTAARRRRRACDEARE